MQDRRSIRCTVEGMAIAVQASLLDGAEVTGLGALSGATRTTLSRGAWVDVLPGWVNGADALLTHPGSTSTHAPRDSVVRVAPLSAPRPVTSAPSSREACTAIAIPSTVHLIERLSCISA